MNLLMIIKHVLSRFKYMQFLHTLFVRVGRFASCNNQCVEVIFVVARAINDVQCLKIPGKV